MALVERLMGLEEPKIAVHAFFASANEIIAGALTTAQVKAFLAMDTPAANEFDALVATAPTGTAAINLAQKALFISRVHSVFVLAEAAVTGYNTPAAVRTKLGI